eukprot:423976-Rhodomonas_salina.1
MDNFANYDSDSDASGGEKEEETATEAVKDTPGATLLYSSRCLRDDMSGVDTAYAAATDAVSANATAAKEPETKKRRVLPKPGRLRCCLPACCGISGPDKLWGLPGAAMSSALPSFLSKKTDDEDRFSRSRFFSPYSLSNSRTLELSNFRGPCRSCSSHPRSQS